MTAASPGAPPAEDRRRRRRASAALTGARSAANGWRYGLAVIAWTLCASCSRPPADATPEGALRLFLDDMDAAGDDPAAVRRAYGLLGPAARANLTERARRTSELQGRHVEPWEMIAAGFFGVAFRPMQMRSKVVGDRAVVEVYGEDPPSEHATVACVRERFAWRIEPGLPPP